MGKITRGTKTEKVTIYTTSDGKKFTGKRALEYAKCHQTDIDLEGLCDMFRPKARELFGFSPISPDDMDNDENFSEEDVIKADREEEGKLSPLEEAFGDIDNFDEFLETMVRMLIQHHEPIQEMILLFREHRIGHKIVHKAKKSLEEK